MKKLFILIGIVSLVGLSSCKKYLDIKSRSDLAIPSNLTDLQAMLDSWWGVGAGVLDESCDDYYLTATYYNSITQDYLKRRYTWQNSNIFPIADSGSDMSLNDWSYTYGMIYYANTVLEYLDKITIKPEEEQRAADIKGQALFLRGRMYLQLVMAFCKGYDAGTASKELGLPLRLSTDFNEKTPRSSLEITYGQILQDFNAALPLLPDQTIQVMRPRKAAVYGMLARTYLTMRNYEQARLYADACLQIQSTLLDYNTITNTSTPFTRFQVPEVIFDWWHSGILSRLSTSLIDPALIELYAPNDLRKTLYFKKNVDGTYISKTSYDGSRSAQFDGIATDEMYLIRAEGFARKGDLISAMKDLDTLLENRYANTSAYVKHVTTDQRQAINWILEERRKELLFRGLRWMDIKRLNLEGANITLKRTVNGTTYTLPPNSPRYATPIPDDVIQVSGLEQNQY